MVKDYTKSSKSLYLKPPQAKMFKE